MMPRSLVLIGCTPQAKEAEAIVDHPHLAIASRRRIFILVSSASRRWYAVMQAVEQKPMCQ
jgi:hypothetical protein